MNSKLLRIAQAILLVLTGALAWGAVGKVTPSSFGVGQVLTASASALSVQPAGPATPLAPVGSGFTYQGRLLDGGNPANGTYDLRFTLFDALTGGSVIGSPVNVPNQTVTNGLFTVTLDFGSTAFNGDGRWLEIAVQHNGGGYTVLAPRQPLTPTPYALFAMKTQGYKNVVVVAKAGGDFTSIQAALDSITDATGAHHYLVEIAPGVYTETVTMKQYVDIEGSGEKTTRITFTGSPAEDTGTVVGADNAELRSLTVRNTGGDNFAIAIYNSNASPSLLHVTANASGASGIGYNLGVVNDNNSSPTMTNVLATADTNSGGIYNYGVYNDNNSSPTMTNVTAMASGGLDAFGVDNLSGSPIMDDVTAAASGGSNLNHGVGMGINSTMTIHNSTISATGASGTRIGVYETISSGSTVRIDNSTITGSTNSIDNEGGTIRVGASKLGGGPVVNGGGGTTSCAGVHDENYIFYANTCP